MENSFSQHWYWMWIFLCVYEGSEDTCYTMTKCFWTLLYSATLAFNSINVYWKPVSQELCWPWGYKDDVEGHESLALRDDMKQKY